MSIAINFYKGKIKANNKNDYFYRDIMKWDDTKMEERHDFIQYLFPDRRGGVNPLAPKLTKEDINIFKTDRKIRVRVAKATIKMLNFYGFSLGPDLKLRQIKPIKRYENGILVGLYSTHNYARLIRIMKFLNEINMKKLSAIVFLMICKAMRKDNDLYELIKKKNMLEPLKDTQSYIRNKYKDNSKGESKEGESKEGESKEGDNLSTDLIGLHYTNNSCYQDTSLLCLFGIPNKFITDNILKRDLNDIKGSFIDCGKGRNGIINRKNIQNELNIIADTMRGNRNENRNTCTQLRSLLSKCRSSQAYHTGRTQDAGEFIQFLFNIFEVEGMKIEKEIYISRKDGEPIKTSNTRLNVSPFVSIHNSYMWGREEIRFSDFFGTPEITNFDKDNLFSYKYKDKIKKYDTRIEYTRYVDVPYLIINLQRLHKIENSVGRLEIPVLYDETLTIGDNKLELFGIICHRNNHYTAYIKRVDNTWLFYDDIIYGMHRKMKGIGSFDRMYNSFPKIKYDSTIFFYKQ